MKMLRYETLGMYVWDKPKTLTQKQYNEASVPCGYRPSSTKSSTFWTRRR